AALKLAHHAGPEIRGSYRLASLQLWVKAWGWGNLDLHLEPQDFRESRSTEQWAAGSRTTPGSGQRLGQQMSGRGSEHLGARQMELKGSRKDWKSSASGLRAPVVGRCLCLVESEGQLPPAPQPASPGSVLLPTLTQPHTELPCLHLLGSEFLALDLVLVSDLQNSCSVQQLSPPTLTPKLEA
ncbi:hypothetical protein P7K49_031307, partial [Saguinus oedipus]